MEVTGDTDILDEQIPFIDGPLLTEEQHDNFFEPAVSHISAKPAARTVNATAAAHHAEYRRNAQAAPVPAAAAATPGHNGGSTLKTK